MTDLSVPLEELPTFLATISMVGDDEREIVKRLTHAERKSPARYEPARQIFLRILTGDLTYDAGLTQALKVPDAIEKDCAVAVLRASRRFLADQPQARLETVPAMMATLPNGLELKVGPLWVRHADFERLLVLHFWQSELSPRQLSAAAAILRLAFAQNKPLCGFLDLDFVSVSVPERSDARRFQCYDWKRLAPLGEPGLLKFSEQLASAWSAYRRIGPREIKRRPRQPGLFG